MEVCQMLSMLFLIQSALLKTSWQKYVKKKLAIYCLFLAIFVAFLLFYNDAHFLKHNLGVHFRSLFCVWVWVKLANFYLTLQQGIRILPTQVRVKRL